MAAPSVPLERTSQWRPSRWLGWSVLAAAAVILFVTFRGQWVLPHDDDAPLFRSLNGIRDWVDANRASSPIFVAFFDVIRRGIGSLVGAFEAVLTGMAWYGVVAVAGTLGLAAGGWRIGLLATGSFLAFGVLGLWTSSIETLALTLAAVILSLVVGIPLGILAGRSARFERLISPVLDVMQIMPTFAYLAPITLLFLIGAPSATIATMIYAIPPAIRITSLGIRGVNAAAIEAAVSMGSTRWQLLRKVQLPLARRTIGLGINQTIMMALSMVVITALIAAPGLGQNIVKALERVDVGAAFDAGLAIVILAVVLDRVTHHAGERLDPRHAISAGPERARRPLLVGAIVASVVLVAAGLLLAGGTEFPKDWRFSFRDPVNALSDWIQTNLFVVTDALKNAFTEVFLNPLEAILTSAPWWLVVIVAGGIALLLSGLRAAIIAAACLMLIASFQLWEHGMATLTTVLLATAITLGVGLVFGIVAARKDRFSTALRPVLDAAQTMPAFVYLLPAVALFGASRFTAIVASLIYAAPAVIRLVESGIRSVSPTVIEAATAAGSSTWQLIWKVQLPMSRHALLLAANQGIVLVLAMVVVGGLVGAGALGYDVVVGFAQRTDFGKGLAAGLCIVIMGVMLDRITQGLGSRPSDRVRRSG